MLRGRRGVWESGGGAAPRPSGAGEEKMISKNVVVPFKVRGAPQGKGIGKMDLARFITPAGFLAKGNGLFAETDGRGPPKTHPRGRGGKNEKKKGGVSRKGQGRPTGGGER